jgi:hypothetical protein
MGCEGSLCGGSCACIHAHVALVLDGSCSECRMGAVAGTNDDN